MLPRSSRRSFIKALSALAATSLRLPSFAHTSSKPSGDPIADIFNDAFNSLPAYNGISFSDIIKANLPIAVAVWLPHNITKQQTAQYFVSHKSRFPNLRNTYIYALGQYEEAQDSTNPQLPHELRIAAMTSNFDETYQACITLDTRPYNLKD